MQYTDGSFADVKSVSQQAMCRYWARTAGDLPFPSLDQFRPEARLHDPKQLIIWSVERRANGHTFRALYQGATVGEVFNSNWARKSMEEVLPPALRELGLAAAEQCVTSGCAIYSVFSTFNSVALAFALARRWPQVLSNAADPGWVRMRMGGPGAPVDIETGQRTQTWLAVSEEPTALVSGRYWHHMRQEQPASEAADPEFQDQLIARLSELTGVTLPGT